MTLGRSSLRYGWIWLLCDVVFEHVTLHHVSPHAQRFVNDLGDAATVESGPKMIGRTMAVIIAPRKAVVA